MPETALEASCNGVNVHRPIGDYRDGASDDGLVDSTGAHCITSCGHRCQVVLDVQHRFDSVRAALGGRWGIDDDLFNRRCDDVSWIGVGFVHHGDAAMPNPIVGDGERGDGHRCWCTGEEIDRAESNRAHPGAVLIIGAAQIDVFDCRERIDGGVDRQCQRSFESDDPALPIDEQSALRSRKVDEGCLGERRHRERR